MSLFPDGADFPEPLMFEGNIEYIRDVIARTDCFTKNSKVTSAFIICHRTTFSDSIINP